MRLLYHIINALTAYGQYDHLPIDLLQLIGGIRPEYSHDLFPSCHPLKSMDQIRERTATKPLLLWLFNPYHQFTLAMGPSIERICSMYNTDPSTGYQVGTVNIMESDRKSIGDNFDLSSQDPPDMYLVYERHGRHIITKFMETDKYFRNRSVDFGLLEIQFWAKRLILPIEKLHDVYSVLNFLASHKAHNKVILRDPGESSLSLEDLQISKSDVVFGVINPSTFSYNMPLVEQTVGSDSDQMPVYDYISRDLGGRAVDSWLQQLLTDPLFVIIRNSHYYMGEDHAAFHPRRPDRDGIQVREKPIIDNRGDLSKLTFQADDIKDDESLLAAVSKSLDTLRLPSVTQLTSSDLAVAIDQNKPMILFAAQTTEEMSGEVYDALFNAAEAYRSKAIFMIATLDDPVNSRFEVSIMRLLSVRSTDLPLIKMFVAVGEPGNEENKTFITYCPPFGFHSMHEPNYDIGAIGQFIAQYENNELVPCVRSEDYHDPGDLPANEPEHLIGNTFYHEVFEKDLHKDMLIVIHAPWCGHCKSFEPQVKKLKEWANLIETLRIAKIDGTANDLPGMVTVSAFPTIVFFKGKEIGTEGGRGAPIMYNEGRRAEEVLKWISQNAQNKFSPEDVFTRSIDEGSGGKLSRAAQIRAILDEL